MRETETDVPLDFILGGNNDGTKIANKRTKIVSVYNKLVLIWQ